MSLLAVARDTAILGIFTSSRVSEYAQSQRLEGTAFHTVTFNATSGVDDRNPVTIIISYLSFIPLLD